MENENTTQTENVEKIDTQELLAAKKNVLVALKKEMEEVEARIRNLHEMLYGGNPKKIIVDANEAFLLHQQYAYMRAYISTLDNRIKYTEHIIDVLESPEKYQQT